MRVQYGFKSQDAFAETLGVTRQSVSLWENGDGEPQPANYAGLVDMFGSALPPLPTHGPSSVSALDRARYQGQALEVASLMRYALQRQEALARVLGGDAVLPSVPFTEVLDADEPEHRRRHG